MSSKIIDTLLNLTENKFPPIYLDGFCKLVEIIRLNTEITEDDAVSSDNLIVKKSERGVTYVKPVNVLFNPAVQKLLQKTARIKIYKPISLNKIIIEGDQYIYLATTEQIFKYRMQEDGFIDKGKNLYIWFNRDISTFYDNARINLILKYSVGRLLNTGAILLTYGDRRVFTDGHEEDGKMNLYGYPNNVEDENSYLVDIIYNKKRNDEEDDE